MTNTSQTASPKFNWSTEGDRPSTLYTQPRYRPASISTVTGLVAVKARAPVVYVPVFSTEFKWCVISCIAITFLFIASTENTMPTLTDVVRWESDSKAVVESGHCL